MNGLMDVLGLCGNFSGPLQLSVSSQMKLKLKKDSCHRLTVEKAHLLSRGFSAQILSMSLLCCYSWIQSLSTAPSFVCSQKDTTIYCFGDTIL